MLFIVLLAAAVVGYNFRVLQTGPSYQIRVHEWIKTCFDKSIVLDKRERDLRLFEEVCELIQAGGQTNKTTLKKVMDYVWNREVGEISQEVGGVSVCIAAWCNAYKIDYNQCSEKELARCWSKIDKIRIKHGSKPSFIKS